jgi:hypothetical protein
VVIRSLVLTLALGMVLVTNLGCGSKKDSSQLPAGATELKPLPSPGAPGGGEAKPPAGKPGGGPNVQ